MQQPINDFGNQSYDYNFEDDHFKLVGFKWLFIAFFITLSIAASFYFYQIKRKAILEQEQEQIVIKEKQNQLKQERLKLALDKKVQYELGEVLVKLSSAKKEDRLTALTMIRESQMKKTLDYLEIQIHQETDAEVLVKMKLLIKFLDTLPDNPVKK